MREVPSPGGAHVVCAARAYSIDEHKIERLASLICGPLGVSGYQLGVTLAGSTAIRRLNSRFRGIDKATDVLSFPQHEWTEPVRVRASRVRPTGRRRLGIPDGPPPVLGDVIISLPDAEKNACSIGQRLDREVCFLLVHGILHLCGHDHETKAEERRMLAAQRALMNYLTRQCSRPPWTNSVRRRRG
jgi:probable rRNA maturation factor